MLDQAALSHAGQSTTASLMMHAAPVQDVSGYTIFSTGAAGSAHTIAHQKLDENRIELGHQLLGKWLDGHTGSDSDWIHLQFHMAVFELELNDWDAAYTRFKSEILPAAASSEDALTDAPALLWRLALTAPERIELPWEALRRTALARMQRPSDPFVELHNLLALAGAGDVAGIERWLQTRPGNASSQPECLVEQMAVALKAYAAHAYRLAAALLQRVVPMLSQVGGSRAQNLLFRQLEESCWYPDNDLARPSLFTTAA